MKSQNVFLTLLLSVLFLGTAAVNAQNFSGIKDKKLNKIDDVTSAITGILSAKVTGEFSDITVTHDSENELRLKIEYTGFETAYMRIAIQDNKKKDQRLIRKQEFSLQGKTSPLEITFNLSESAEEGTAFESTYLEIKMAKKKGSFPKIYLYSLNKKWQKNINPENLVIPVALEPIGSAADLKATEEVLVKPKTKPKFKIATINPAIFKAATLKKPALTVVKPGTTTTKPAANTTNSTTSTKSNSIDGTWINTNKNTTGISRIVISNNGKKIHVYKKCSPKDCDWGARTLSPLRGVKMYKATYATTMYTSTLTLNFTKDLKVTRNTAYRLMGRKSSKTEETFKKQVLFIYRPIVVSKPPTGRPATTSNNKNPEGPDNSPVSLWDDLASDHNFEFPYEITNIRMDIYPDKNPKSGMFYYMPDAYHLRWNADEGYQFRMLYGTGDDGASGDIRMAGTLTPAIGSAEIDLMKKLLESYARNNPEYKVKDVKLKIMPLKSNPKISLVSGLEGQYNIDADKISVGVQSTITAPIEVSWVTDNRTKEEMQVALSEGVGIQGAMTLVPESETVPEQLIPVRIALADTRTLGRLTLDPDKKWRNEEWVNNTPYPLKLKNIHALVINREGLKTVPLVYTWNLGDVEVPAKAKVNFNASKMPEWLETKKKIIRLWIDYSIADCETCVNQVVDELTGGTSGSKVKNVTFESFQVFEKLDAALLRVKIRSKQADPKGSAVAELSSVRMEEDMSTYSAGPLYLPEGENIQYEYFFTVVMKDGRSYNSDAWKSSGEQEMFIGLHTLKESISSLSEIIED